MLMLLVIAVSLSMDAFSLSLAYGTLSLSKKNILQLSFIVGLYHFFMPLIGMIIGSTLLHFFPLKPAWLVLIVLTIIGVQMIIESFKKSSDQFLMGFKELIIFGFAVSVDSFSVGISLKLFGPNYLLSALIFSLFSFIFTYLGLFLGKKISNIVGKMATFIGGIVLILIGVIYLLK